jgi:chromosome segregation ATPase
MAPISLTAWERFYERVVARGGNWPRALWFAAVEDGLEGALPENSRLLAEYRRHVAEWKQLEGEATGRHGDAQRVAQLEADIMRLIGHANQTIRERAADAQMARVAPVPGPRRERSGAWLGGLTVAVMLLCGGVLGATYYQNRLMMQRMEHDLVALHQQLIQQAANDGVALEARIRSIETVRQDLEAAQAELRANVAQFNQVMSASVRSITALGDSALGDLARRLGAEDGNLEAALTALRGRAATLEGELDGTAQSLASLARRLPEVGSDIERLAGQVAATDADFEEVAGQVQTIKAQAPEIALWLEGQRQGLVQTVETHRQSMDEADFEIATLKGALNESRGQLQSFQETIEGDLAQAKQQGGDLEQALEDVRATELRAAELLTRIEARAEAAQGDLQGRIEAILAELAEAADLAVLRSQEVTRRAEAEGVRLEAVAEQAIEGLSTAREQRLAELSQWAAATRSGLAQTHAGLVAGWQGMDQAVAERHSDVLANLDRYAATLEGRVQELLDALEVILVRSDG